MKSVFITGSSGFIGSFFQSIFKGHFTFIKYKRDSKINISEQIVFHFAGKAHDLKNVSQKKEYYKVNSEFTKKVIDKFLESVSKVMIFKFGLSSS